MSEINFSKKQLEAIYRPFREFEVHEGSPRSGKTTAAHFRYAKYLINSRDTHHLIVAYNQEQAYRLFVEGDGTGLQHIFSRWCKVRHNEHGDHLEIQTPNGSKRVYYKGGSKANSVGSVTGMSLGSVVFCEINLLHLSMIQECFRRTFAAKDRYFLADLNPPSPNHPIIKEVFEVQDMRWTHWTIHDNPIITEERKHKLYETLRKNPYLLKRDWYGQRVVPQGVIYSMFDMDVHTEPTLLGKTYEMYFAADGGQGDATSVSCNIVTRYQEKFRLNRVAHYYHSGTDTGQVKAMSTYAKEIKEMVKWCTDQYQLHVQTFFVDPACRSLREELRLLGIDTQGADNNFKDIQGSIQGIEVGIERAQNAITELRFFIIETDKYDHYHYLKEIGLYARDDNGTPIDTHNHAMDEFRYSINYFYRRYVL